MPYLKFIGGTDRHPRLGEIRGGDRQMDIGGFKIGSVVVGEHPDHPAWRDAGSDPVVGLLLNGSPFFANVLTDNCTETSLAPASLRLATDAERAAWWRALEPQLVDTADNIIPDGVRDFMARNGG